MKMLRIAAGVALAACFALFAGCATNGPVKLIPPKQLVTDFCPIVNADLKVLAASPLLNATQQQLLNGIPGDVAHPGIIAINKAVCAAGATIDATDLQTLNNTAFPALIGLVSALPMLPNQPAILLGLTLAQPILNQVAAQILPTEPAAASAPVAASSPQ
ncbi:hypothetical protein AB1286_29835 [Trinickia sp. NRRL B-1857]|uniref:hypothetical protein n=1 Tax=Trinickia sp. NRRL B-1857 TaxID=3162879 RepID=UPI003D2BFCBC